MTATPASRIRERSVEAHLVDRVSRIGGQCHKLVPSNAGIPDRLVILPGAGMHLVELKAPRGRVSPIQQVWHTRVRALGVRIHILYTCEQVDAWIRETLDRAVLEADRAVRLARR